MSAIQPVTSDTAASRIISRFGGLTKAARAWSKPKSTVQRWKDSGFIHPDYYPGILSAAVNGGVLLDAADFNPVDAKHPAFNAPQTPSPDNTADRAPGSSLSPIPDIAGSPPSDAGQTASGEEEVRGDISSSSSDPQSVTPVGVESVS